MKRNDCLNLIKCIACCGVVFMHITFPGEMGKIIHGIFMWAVPLFIMIAGYYAYGCDTEKIKKRLKKTIKLFIFGYLVWLAFQMAMAVRENNVANWINFYYNWKTPVIFVVFCTVRWAIPLWYLVAMIETYLLWLVVIKKKAEKKIVKLTWVLFILGTVWTIIMDSLEMEWFYRTIFLFKALPWFMFGYLVKARFEGHIKRVADYKFLLFITAGALISILPDLIKTPVNFADLGVLMTAPAIFLWGIKNAHINITRPIAYIGDRVTAFIYIFHVPMTKVVETFVNKIGIDRSGGYSYVHPIVVLVATVAFSVLFEKMIRKTNLKRFIS